MVTHYSLTRRSLLAASGSLVASSALSGCLGSGSDPATGDGGLPTDVEVTMTSTPSPLFDPRLVHVGVGATVVWKLHSGDHDTTAYHPETYGPLRIPEAAEPWASPQLTAVGETFEHTFEIEGVYDYVDTTAVCIAHEVIGNVGRVIVGWPDFDPGVEPALREPQAELPDVARTRLAELNEQTREILSEPTPTDP